MVVVVVVILPISMCMSVCVRSYVCVRVLLGMILAQYGISCYT